MIAEAYLRADFGEAFEAKFGTGIPETLNGNHRVLVVGSVIDSSSDCGARCRRVGPFGGLMEPLWNHTAAPGRNQG